MIHVSVSAAPLGDFREGEIRPASWAMGFPVETPCASSGRRRRAKRARGRSQRAAAAEAAATRGRRCIARVVLVRLTYSPTAAGQPRLMAELRSSRAQQYDGALAV